MNWPALMHIGLGHLRLSPDVFWSMTPREFVACAGIQTANPAMSRDALDALIGQHPDIIHD